MQRLTAAPRDHLTEQEVMSLLTGDQVTVDFGADLLNADLSFVEDISADLVSATVERRMLNRIHGTARFRLSRELQWGTALVRLWQRLRMPDGVETVHVDPGPSPYLLDVLDGSPLVYYRFDDQDKSGQVLDESRYGRHATYAAIATNVDDTPLASGGRALSPGGSSGGVWNNGPTDLGSFADGLSVEIWLRMPADRAAWSGFYAHHLSGKGTAGQATANHHVYAFGDYNDNGQAGLVALYGGFGGVWSSPTGTYRLPFDGLWHYLVLTYDVASGDGRIYLDGVQVKWYDGAAGRAVAVNADALYGSLPPSTASDEYVFHERALTPDEVAERFAAATDPGDPSTITRPVERWARFNIGVFATVTPEHPRGETPVTYDVSAFDRLYLLDRQVGEDYTVLAGTTYRDALLQAFADAGLTGVDIDGSAADDTLPKDKTWPLVSRDMSDPDQTSTPVTFLRVVNDLGRMINMRGVWTDANGRYRLQSYRDPKTAGSEFTLDADSHMTILGEDRTIIEDMWATPNKWVVISANPPDGVTPTEANGLIQVRENLDDGPTSQSQRGMVWTAVYSYEAATVAKLSALADRRMAQDLRVTRRIEVATGPLPVAGHFDVVTLKDADAGLNVKAQATAWERDLSGAQDDRFTFEVI